MTDLDSIIETISNRVAEKVAAKLELSQLSPKRLFTVAEAADYLGRSKHAVYQMRAQRKLPAVEDGARVLFDKADLDLWIQVHRRESVGRSSQTRPASKPVKSSHVPPSILRKSSA